MKRIWLSLVMVLAVVCGMFVTSPVVAADDENILDANKSICDDDKISDDLKEIAGCKLEKDDTAMPVAINLINVALSLVGILAVAIVIYGGVSYVISNGDAAKVTKAKNSILYGIVGLVVALLAFSIVYFVSQSIWG